MLTGVILFIAVLVSRAIVYYVVRGRRHPDETTHESCGLGGALRSRCCGSSSRHSTSSAPWNAAKGMVGPHKRTPGVGSPRGSRRLLFCTRPYARSQTAFRPSSIGQDSR